MRYTETTRQNLHALNAKAGEYRRFIAQTATANFAEMAYAHIRRLGLNRLVFTERTLLDESQYRKLKYGRTRQVIFDTAMAVCVGLDLGLEYGVPLLEKAGYSLEGEDRFPYKVLLAFYRGHTIFECNEYLIDQGVKPLREAVCRGSSGKK